MNYSHGAWLGGLEGPAGLGTVFCICSSSGNNGRYSFNP